MKATSITLAGLSLALALAATGASFAADASPGGTGILAAIDVQRNFGGSDFSAVMSMVKEDPEEGVDKKVVQQFRRDRENELVLIFLEPVVQKGQGYLRIDDNLWFYDPESRQFSHESMKERFGGTDARNSDFGKSSLAADYTVSAAEDGVLGKYTVSILTLAATNNEVTYPGMKLWVTRDLSLLLKEEDYSGTGRLVRTCLFPNYTKVGATYVPSRAIIQDELVPGKKTTILLSDISVAALPDSVFTKTWLERVNR
jgi:outer membrane lipoprotein-sorting protein